MLWHKGHQMAGWGRGDSQPNKALHSSGEMRREAEDWKQIQATAKEKWERSCEE